MESITLSEVSQTQTNATHTLSHYIHIYIYIQYNGCVPYAAREEIMRGTDLTEGKKM